jgi:hypothetical protein
MLHQGYHTTILVCHLLILSSLRSDCTQAISAAAFAIDLYSASVLDLETVGCFFALHAKRLGPKNSTKPPMERL